MSAHTRDELIEITDRWVEEGWRKGNTEAVYAMYSEDFVDLSHPSGKRATREDNVRSLAELYQAFPDFYVDVEFLVVDVDTGRVAVRWTAHGTHQGRFFSIDPTGNRVLFHGIETLKIENGLIVERTGDWDAIEILQQLGVRLWMG